MIDHSFEPPYAVAGMVHGNERMPTFSCFDKRRLDSEFARPSFQTHRLVDYKIFSVSVNLATKLMKGAREGGSVPR